MFSKTPVILAAGLLSSVWAQNGTFTNGTFTNVTVSATVTVDIYAATTTIQQQCSVCTPGASPQQYTVVVGNGVTTTLGGGGAGVSAESTAVPDNGGSGSSGSSAAGASSNSAGAGVSATSSNLASCGFGLAVNGGTPLQQISDGQIQASQNVPLQQISDGQIQASQGASTGLTSTTFTIANGMVYDNAGRICSISGQNQSQFQCNYVPTDGSTTTTFSLVGSNLAFNGVTQFYQCLLGAPGAGYNIYFELTGNQHTCTPITLVASPAAGCTTPVVTPVVAPVVSAAPVTTLQPVVVVSTPQPTTSVAPAATTTTAAATAIFVSSSASTKASVYGLVATTFFAFFLL